MKDFRDLKVWQKSYELTLTCYAATMSFPETEAFALVSEIRRSSSSIPASIANGCGRGGSAELIRSSKKALRSANKLEHFLLMARNLNLLSKSDHEDLQSCVTQVKRLLGSLIVKLSRKRKRYTQ